MSDTIDRLHMVTCTGRPTQYAATQAWAEGILTQWLAEHEAAGFRLVSRETFKDGSGEFVLTDDYDTVTLAIGWEPSRVSFALHWSAGRYVTRSDEVSLAFLGVDDARRSFRPGTVLSFVGGPDAGRSVVVTGQEVVATAGA